MKKRKNEKPEESKRKKNIWKEQDKIFGDNNRKKRKNIRLQKILQMIVIEVNLQWLLVPKKQIGNERTHQQMIQIIRIMLMMVRVEENESQDL